MYITRQYSNILLSKTVIYLKFDLILIKLPVNFYRCVIYSVVIWFYTNLSENLILYWAHKNYVGIMSLFRFRFKLNISKACLISHNTIPVNLNNVEMYKKQMRNLWVEWECLMSVFKWRSPRPEPLASFEYASSILL